MAPTTSDTESRQGDPNNIASMPKARKIIAKPEFANCSLAMSLKADDKIAKYRPFLLDDTIFKNDWVSTLELATVTEMTQRDTAINGQRLRVLVLYGSLRSR